MKTLGVNLNLFQKDPTIKLMTLTKNVCNEYKSTVNLFLHYYPGFKQGKHLDAHYNCYVNTQYYKQNAAAISSRMVKTIEEEEAEKSSQKQNKSDPSSSVTQKLQSSSSTQGAEGKKL